MRLNRFVLGALFFAAALAAFADDDTGPLTWQQTPRPVRLTVTAQIGKGTLGDIYQSDEDGQTTYDIGFTGTNGEEGGICVAADGALVSAEVALNETPAPVQKTIQTEAAGWQLEGIDKSVEESGTTYDVEVSKSGSTQNFTVDDDGTLLSVTTSLDQTPDPVKSAIQALAKGGRLVSIDKNVDDAEITFDVEVSGSNGATKTSTLADDGTLLSAEVALAETPPAVQAAIAQQIRRGAVESIDENFDPDGNSFDVVAASRGLKTSFTVGLDGTLASVEVTLDQTPPGARATIENQIAGGKIIRIDKSIVDKQGRVLPYEVQGRKAGKPFDFSVGPKGRFLGMDD
jgi:hypothetical protein